MNVDLYLVIPEHRHFIDLGSGIAGQQPGAERTTIYFEGNRYGASNIVTFADRCLHAADRMIARYPTIAQKSVPSEDLQHIGYLDMTFGEVHLDDAEAERALAAWLGGDRLDMTQLQTTDARSDLRTVRGWSATQRRQIRHLPPSERARYERAGLI